MSDGRPQNTVAEVESAADRAKANNMLLITVCVGSDCDVSLMRQVASRPDLFFNVLSPQGLTDIYEQIANLLLSTDLTRMSIVDLLPDNMRYIPGSAVPPLSSSGPNLPC